MRRITAIALLSLAYVVAAFVTARGQEHAGPLYFNQLLNTSKKAEAPARSLRTTAHTLSLPFFEDFTGYSIYPDSSNWTDYEAFINNTMGVNPISRGVATLDALNPIGIPYDSFSNTNFRYADSLTSQPIDMDISHLGPGDSVYLSFFYQPQGNGFYPLTQDSLFLYMKTMFGGYERVWFTPGDKLEPFKQVMIAITDTLYFHGDFQFRFVNRAGLDWSDAIWNIDYIRLDKNRNMNDTAVNDIGFTNDPTFLLNDYTSMPYRQFIPYKGSQLAAQYVNTVRNNLQASEPITYTFKAQSLNTGGTLQLPVNNTATIAANSIQTITNAAYTTTLPSTTVSPYEKLTFENTYYLQANASTGSTGNDTIVKDVVFDNYMAYDDGTAEKSYYLTLYPTLPGKVAIEYYLNQPDTLQGISIYFGKQLPYASYKFFALQVYSQLANVNGATIDNLLMQQDLVNPVYMDTVNHFTNYKLDKPLVLPAGLFYIGTLQIPNSGNDSIYYGLDVNRIGGNHTYYNVLNSWNPSLITGAIMMRPILGQAIVGLGARDIADDKQKWRIWPNPANDELHLDYQPKTRADYSITDILGKTVQAGAVPASKTIYIASLTPGVYFVSLRAEGVTATPLKMVKL